ncbi:high affinity cGMP-specific 3',5'-cyclic phosphodiesterase 9A-like isoform X2 [Amphiura filiformis]|uniref:high affinity cGMP-specific 3',5'-cyclic phosphodiesterase 9A-like isoform X2 n=1 Tax=Amphiura filiformis TaxID=82378 RepID=UPI003B21D102
MATKVIYFTIAGRPEQAEFRSDFPADDVKDVFRAAAEARQHDILKLYNTRGNIVNICPKLEENTPDKPYKLEVVAAQCSLAEQLGFDVNEMESRLEMLEKKVMVDSGETPSVVYELRNKVEDFRQKLESVEHLSWLGLFKDFAVGSQSSNLPFYKRKLKKTDVEQRRVLEKFNKIKSVQLTDDVREFLRLPTFDNWQWEDAEMLLLLQQMFIDLEFTTRLNIELSVLQNFLFEVFRHYNNVPFHNFKHCFCVAQMMYGIIWLADMQELLGDLECFIMLVSAICHDLDHPGYNNSYQVNAKTELALRYNDISPLENHHCSVAFQLMEKPHCNILKNLGPEKYKKAREGMIFCILATDMAKHNEILNQFKSLLPNFDYSKSDHVNQLMKVSIKVADISNEARPMDVSEPWIDCLLQEFFNQRSLEQLEGLPSSTPPYTPSSTHLDVTKSDMEKLEGLPISPFMDREKVSKSSSQTGFIQFVLLPLFESLGQLLPKLEPHIIMPVRKALEYYSDMTKAMEEEKRRKEEQKQNSKEELKNITKENGTLSLQKQNGQPPNTRVPSPGAISTGSNSAKERKILKSGNPHSNNPHSNQSIVGKTNIKAK